MSVGSKDPKSQGTPPVPVTRTRFDARPMHNVSYKLTKSKPSKAKYLTSKELLGIGLSVVVSFAIACTLVFVGINVVPVVMRFISEIIMDVVDASKSRAESITAVHGAPAYSRFLTVQSELTCSLFTSQVEDKDVALIETAATKALASNFTAVLAGILSSTLISLHHITRQQPLENTGATELTMTVADFVRGQFSLNNDVESGNHWVTYDLSQLPLPTISDALHTPLLPETANAHDACTMRYPPLGDFVPTVLTLARNDSTLSGGAFHSHKRSVSLLLEGRKRWVLFPPDQLLNGGFSEEENLQDWRASVQPTLTAADSRPVEVFQEAGQALYIPEGWYHASQTLTHTSFSVRYTPAEELPGDFLFYLARGDQKALTGDYQAAVKLYRLGLAMRKDIVLVVHLGAALEKLGLYAEAETAYTEAVERNPRSASHFVRLINLLVSHSSKDSSAAVADLLQRAEAFGLKAQVLRRLEDVF